MAASSGPTNKQRKLWANLGWAMPDGSYYIRPLVQGGADDLSNAVRAVGRGENAGDSGAAIRKHIIARAKDLGLTKDIPDTWNPDGTLKADATHFDQVDDFLEHFGVKGMHWGVRKGRSAPKGPASEDHEKTANLQKKVSTSGGIHSLSNEELRLLNDRLNLEQNYNRLTAPTVKNGEDFVSRVVKRSAEKQAQVYVDKGTKALAEWAISEGAKHLVAPHTGTHARK